jgi:UDP-N-acetylmuramoyl-tripeptide--D-alanyl-D-alanine ligase
LLEFVPVEVAVVTSISSVHLEFFKSIEHIGREKGKIVEFLPDDGCAILNADDKRVLEMKNSTKAKTITYGFSENADVRATDAYYINNGDEPEGISFKLNYEGKSIPVRLRKILAEHQIQAALAAISTGIVFKINLVDIAAALEDFSSPHGRMNMIPGANGSMIIDDTYNASPASTMAAIKVAGNLRSKRKIFVLGDMLELGQDESDGHKEVAKEIFKSNADLFFSVGSRMGIAVRELEKFGFAKEKIFSFESPIDAAGALAQKIKPGDLILVKGSQGMRMEKIVEKIMEDPAQARKLLCRQSEEWWKKPYVKP